MDVYHIWADLKDGVNDLEFADNVRRYMAHLQEHKLIDSFRITRRKLGLSTVPIGEWHIEVFTENLGQLEQAFQRAASRTGEVERLHKAVYSSVQKVDFALYRDFPDAVRQNIVGM